MKYRRISTRLGIHNRSYYIGEFLSDCADMGLNLMIYLCSELNAKLNR